MATYRINKTNGQAYLDLAEGVLDQTLGISLIGQNYHNYGQLIANNFVQMLENQANSVPPSNPIEGQLWWDTSTQHLRYFDGNKFKTISNSAIHSDPPFKPLAGDQWWDSANNQLKIFGDEDWVLIGPLNPLGQHFSGIMPLSVTDNSSVQHSIAVLTVDGIHLGILNKDDPFTLSTTINGMANIGTGITMAPGTVYLGDAQNALQLGGVSANRYVRTTDVSTSLDGSLTIKGTNGLAVGSTSDALRIYKNSVGALHEISSANTKVKVASGTAAILFDGVNNIVTVSVEPTTLSSVTSKHYVDELVSMTDATARTYVDTQISQINGNAIVDSLEALSNAIDNDFNYHINVAAALNFKANIHSPDFTGFPQAPTPVVADNSRKIATTAFVKTAVATMANGSLSGSAINSDILPTVTNQFNIGSSSLRFVNVYGTAMRANYADLAENYATDIYYPPGTVVVFGGKHEVTVSDILMDHRVAGIISSTPGYLMNDNAGDGYQAVALTGKVPCFVVGEVSKGDLLVTSGIKGVATRLSNITDWRPGAVIGKSLVDNNLDGIQLITVAVGRF